MPGTARPPAPDRQRVGTPVPAGPRELWHHRFASPPPDVAIRTSPPAARRRAAREVARHLEAELARGRSLYCIVRDPHVSRWLGSFDGRALP